MVTISTTRFSGGHDNISFVFTNTTTMVMFPKNLYISTTRDNNFLLESDNEGEKANLTLS